MGTFFPYHYITYGNRHALVRICENGSIMKSLAVVDFFIENKGTFFPYHYITYGNRHALVRICENRSIMKSMAIMETSSLNIKRHDFLVHYICENGSIMKSMAKVDFFIENKRNFLPISLHYLWKADRFGRICENGSIMKSMAMVDFFIENKETLFGRISENGSIMKSMAMVNFFIKKMNFLPISLHYQWKQRRFGHYQQKWVVNEIHDYGTFSPYHYITYGNGAALVRICENRSIMKSMAMVDFFIEYKGTFFPYHYITYGNRPLWTELSSHIITLPMETRPALVIISKNGSLMKSMTMVDFFIENKGTFSPYHYITYGNRHALVRICENGSILKSMAMVDFFIENKGTFFPHPDITYGNRHSLVRISENGSIMKSMAMELSSHIITLPMEAETRFGSCISKNGSLMKSMTMVDFFIENKGTFSPYHYITYGNRHALVRICENRSIMKSMAMVDFFIEYKGKLQLKQQDNINHTKEVSSHIITLPMEAETALDRICENGSIMKSMAMVDFFIENKGTFFPYHYITNGNRHALVRISKNGSLMKSMTMVDFFIENKGTFSPYHYITYGNRHALVRICENGSIMKSMAMVDFFIENKEPRFGHYRENGSIMKSMAKVDFFIENKGTFFPYHYITYGNGCSFGRICKNGSIMKSMAMVDFFIENKGTFFPYHYITNGNRTALVIISKNGSLMKSMTMELSSHIITLPMKNRHAFGRICENRSIMKSMAMVDFFIENKGTFFPYHYITYGNRHALVRICENGSIMKSMAMIDFFNKNKDTLWSYLRKWVENEILGYGDFFIENKGTFFPHRHYLWKTDTLWNFLPISLHYRWKQTSFWSLSAKNGSLMKSMTMVDFFIENKDALWSIICENGSIMKSLAMELSSHIITLPMETDTLWSLYAKMDSIMKSMAMVDFFIENKGKRLLKQQDNINHTKVGKGVNFLYKWELSSHIITLPMETECALVVSAKMDSIMKSMTMVDFFIVNKAKLQLKQQDIINHTKVGKCINVCVNKNFLEYHYITYGSGTTILVRHALVRICENGSIMKSMAMVDFFIENKGTFFPYHYITNGNGDALVIISKNGWLMKSMTMVDFFIENKGTFFPYHYITYGSRLRFGQEHSSHIITLPMETETQLWSGICENDSIMKSMAMIDFFNENKGTFFPYHYITYGNRHALVRICENRSIMKSMAMVDFFIENKGTFFPYHYITYGNRHALVRICENGSIMKSMAMIDFFNENKADTLWSLSAKMDSIMKSMAMVDFFIVNKDPRFGHYLRKWSILKSMAKVDFFIENKGTFFPYHYITYGSRDTLWSIICENGSIMKSMAMVDFFIENKGTFFLYHYITYGNRHALVIICENGSIMKSMAMVDFFIENKRNVLPISLHYLWKQDLRFGHYMRKWVDNEIHGYMVDFFIENKELSSISLHYLWKAEHDLVKELSSHIITLPMEAGPRFGRICENGSIMKSMAMVDFFIENKGTFFPYHYITNGNRHALVRNSKNGWLMKSMTMVDFFIEKKKELSSHIITLPMETDTLWSIICENRSIMKSMAMVDFFIENKGTFFPYHYITYGTETRFGQSRFGPYLRKWSILKSMAKVDFFIENKGTFFPYHYITYGNRHALVRICENGSITKSMAMVDFFIENKGTFFPYHYITYGNRHAFDRICENGSIMKSMAMVDFFIENKGTFFPYHYITYGNRHALVRICENRSIMKSMAMVDFFIENKGTFFPYHYITYGNRHALVRICENGSIMKSMAMVDFFNENNGKLQNKQQDNINHTKVGKGVNFCINGNFLPTSLHYLWKQTCFGPYQRKWVDIEIHGNGRLLHC
ncbi:hypothetical protein H6P81_021563 [Aristolochia fimbriata]|uniref:Uncharacterized protein n=1 Tax=Aristolochia fimbriata TaxID=158543 RepID=A0AAV7DPL7_ARIFI|nr:hypothetical protein H6P81_021563 [Aristolochia fimbriata]